MESEMEENNGAEIKRDRENHEGQKEGREEEELVAN